MTDAEREARELLDDIMSDFALEIPGLKDYQEKFPAYNQAVEGITQAIQRAEKRGYQKGHVKWEENWGHIFEKRSYDKGLLQGYRNGLLKGAEIAENFEENERAYDVDWFAETKYFKPIAEAIRKEANEKQ